jgi:hypothetical protein
MPRERSNRDGPRHVSFSSSASHAVLHPACATQPAARRTGQVASVRTAVTATVV